MTMLISYKTNNGIDNRIYEIISGGAINTAITNNTNKNTFETLPLTLDLIYQFAIKTM